MAGQEPEVHHSAIRLQTYSKDHITVMGSTDVQVIYEGQTTTLPLVVVKGDGPTLLLSRPSDCVLHVKCINRRLQLHHCTRGVGQLGLGVAYTLIMPVLYKER